MAAELFHEDRKDGHDEANTRFPQFANAPKHEGRYRSYNQDYVIAYGLEGRYQRFEQE